jgi:hypothetical protein
MSGAGCFIRERGSFSPQFWRFKSMHSFGICLALVWASMVDDITMVAMHIEEIT